jgi:hypothetical protein
MLRLRSQWAEGVTGSKSAERRAQQADQERIAGLEAAPSLSCDFTNIPMSARSQEQRSSISAIPSTPAAGSVQRAGMGSASRTLGDVAQFHRTTGNQVVCRTQTANVWQNPSFGLKLGNGDRPVPPPKVEPKPERKPDASPEPAAPTITSETKFAAPDGTAKTRTDVGVGEVVTFTGSASGKWTATSGTPVTLASGKTFTWTAPDRAKDVTVKLEVGSQSAISTMKVLEPAGIICARNSTIPIGVGTAGAGMKLTFNYTPKKVSFGNVEAKEVSGPATNITGYFRKHYTDDDLKHDSGDTFTSIKENNEDSAQDTAKSVDTFKPYEVGTFDWVIPNNFRVKTEAGDGKEFTKVTQAFSINAAGTEKITKDGASVERKVTEP